jgi:anti-sigma factor RsiW
MDRHGKLAARLNWAMAAFALAIVAGAFIGGIMWGRGESSERESLIDDVAEYHQIYSREHRRLVKAPTTQGEEQLMASLADHIGRKIETPDLTAAGLRFAGGRMLVVNGRPIAELIYVRDDGLSVALCIARIAGKNAPLSIEQRGLQRTASWIKDGFTYVVVGELDRPTAERLAALVAAQIGG